MDKTIINMQSVSAEIAGKTILKNLNCRIHAGEKIGIIGPSGSGKSSFIRTINLLLPISSGSIHLFDKPLDAKADLLQVGMVFQRFDLFPHLSVMENLTLAPCIVKKMPLDQAQSLACDMLKKVHMDGFEDRFPHSLSGGQAQRVAIARCLVMQPTVLLLDEPTSALDPEMVGEVRQVLEEIIEPHMSIILVSHEIQFLQKIASRMIFMQDGMIAEDKPTEDFFKDLTNQRLAQFLSQIH